MKKLSLMVVLTVFAIALTTGTAGAATALWDTTVTPNVYVDAANQPANGTLMYGSLYNVEEGVKFITERPIYVTGVSFYRHDTTPFTWTGSLWDTAAPAAPLASGPDATEGTGWQTVTFATPVLMVPGQCYVASYYHVGLVTGTGEAGTWYYFTNAGRTVGTVTAVQSQTGYGGNGVYDGQWSHTYPENTYLDLNYWVTPLWVPQYTLSGFYAPVDMGADVYNSVKGGATVPLKFEVFDGASGAEVTGVSAVAGFKIVGIPSPVTGNTVDPIEMVSTGGTSLRYDTIAGQFIQNWKTPKTPGACYAVTVCLTDGSSITANFLLK